MTDKNTIKKDVDLVALVEQDLGPGKRHGSWTMFKCPFHEDITPSLGVKNGSSKYPALYICYGCGQRGDAFSWLMEYRKLPYAESLAFLGGDLYKSPTNNEIRKEIPPSEKEPPDFDWQTSANIVVDNCKKNLWSPIGEKAHTWLNARGLKDNTLRTWNIGYSPGVTIAHLFVPAGILLPCYSHGRWWYLKVRRASGDPKYIKVKGSSGAALWGLNFPWATEAFKFEGEFDQMLFWQETLDFTNAFTFGSATDLLDPFTWGIDFLTFNFIFDAGDTDEAGEKSYTKALSISGRVRRAALPSPHKDITDYWKAGGNIRDWAWYQIGMHEVNS